MLAQVLFSGRGRHAARELGPAGDGFWWRVLGIDIVVMGSSNTLAQELPIARAMQSLSDDYDSQDEFGGLYSIDEESADEVD